MKSIFLYSIIFIIFGFLPHTAFSQNERLRDVYTQNVLNFGDHGFYINDQRLKWREVRPLLNKFPKSASEYEVYRKKAKLSLITGIGIIGCTIGFLDTINQKKGYKYGFSIGYLGFVTWDWILNGQRAKHLQNSVWFYNRDILTQKY